MSVILRVNLQIVWIHLVSMMWLVVVGLAVLILATSSALKHRFFNYLHVPWSVWNWLISLDGISFAWIHILCWFLSVNFVILLLVNGSRGFWPLVFRIFLAIWFCKVWRLIGKNFRFFMHLITSWIMSCVLSVPLIRFKSLPWIKLLLASCKDWWLTWINPWTMLIAIPA